MVGTWVLIACTWAGCIDKGVRAQTVDGLMREQCRAMLDLYTINQQGARCISPDGKIYRSEDDFMAEDYPTQANKGDGR